MAFSLDRRKKGVRRMAFNRKGGSSRPTMFVAFSARVRQGKYIKGPSIGLWPRDEGPQAGGSVKGEYLEELTEFLNKASDKGFDVSVALFNSGGGKSKRRHEEEEEDDDGDGREERSSRRSRHDDEGDEEEKPSRHSKRHEEDEEEEKPSRGKGKGKGKKDDWGFED